MNSSKVQSEIQKIISELHTRIGGKAACKQYSPAKWQIEKLTELGILELMPTKFGHSDADAVIKAATASRTAIMNAAGEGEEIAASDLYLAINEVEAVEKTRHGYEIEIFGIDDDAEMNAVQEALYLARIADGGEDEVGMYLRYNKTRSVFVKPAEVALAVEVINSLGYETDEDSALAGLDGHNN